MEKSFTIINNEGMEVKCDMISLITEDESKIYLLYTDYLLDDKGDFRLLASELVQKDNDYILQDIKDKNKINKLINSAKNPSILAPLN